MNKITQAFAGPIIGYYRLYTSEKYRVALENILSIVINVRFIRLDVIYPTEH